MLLPKCLQYQTNVAVLQFVHSAPGTYGLRDSNPAMLANTEVISHTTSGTHYWLSIDLPLIIRNPRIGAYLSTLICWSVLDENGRRKTVLAFKIPPKAGPLDGSFVSTVILLLLSRNHRFLSGKEIYDFEIIVIRIFPWM